MPETRHVYTVRAFEPEKDLEAVYDCYVSGFHHNQWPLIDQAEKRFLLDSLLTVSRIGDVSLVAEADGRARGLLVGFFPGEKLVLARAAWHFIGFGIKVLFRRYRMTGFARAAFWRGIRGNLSYIVRSGNTPAEVLLLTSEQGYRGGIGRALMDAWVAEVRARGCKNTTVGTDSTVSWEFYERYGFKRIREFDYKGYYYSMPGVDVKAYIYSLDLPPA